MLHDSLVKTRSDRFDSSWSERIDGGRSGKKRLVKSINALLIARLENMRWWCGKGGDPLLFGGAAEEICAAIGEIEFEIAAQGFHGVCALRRRRFR